MLKPPAERGLPASVQRSDAKVAREIVEAVYRVLDRHDLRDGRDAAPHVGRALATMGAAFGADIGDDDGINVMMRFARKEQNRIVDEMDFPRTSGVDISSAWKWGAGAIVSVVLLSAVLLMARVI